MKIIGHRGARGLETENTLESIKKARALGVDAIEFDVWTTKDGVAVLHHDSDLFRLTGTKAQIFDLEHRKILKLKTKDGKAIPAAKAVMAEVRNQEVFFEIKDFYLSSAVKELIDDFRADKVTVTSFNHRVLLDVKKYRPDIKLYAATNWRPIETIHFIRKNNLSGLTLNYKSFNPLIYVLCARLGISIALFAVNSLLYIKLLRFFRIEVDICTDYPNRVIRLLRQP